MWQKFLQTSGNQRLNYVFIIQQFLKSFFEEQYFYKKCAHLS